MNLLKMKPHKQVVGLAIVEYEVGSHRYRGLMSFIAGEESVNQLALLITEKKTPPTFGAN